MKYWMLLCTFSLLVHFSMQGIKYENCPKNVVALGETMDDCMVIKCITTDNNTKVEMRSCDTIVCAEGKQTGFHEGSLFGDYPECCSYPICAE